MLFKDAINLKSLFVMCVNCICYHLLFWFVFCHSVREKRLFWGILLWTFRLLCQWECFTSTIGLQLFNLQLKNMKLLVTALVSVATLVWILNVEPTLRRRISFSLSSSSCFKIAFPSFKSSISLSKASFSFSICSTCSCTHNNKLFLMIAM